MGGFLFEQIVFGPIRSRRLGISLGVNLLPLDKKLCTYNCLYCECGWTLSANENNKLPDKESVALALEMRLQALKDKNAMIDSITFAGNGEPTLHPEFGHIIDSTIEIRNRFYPKAKITVLSNGTQAGNPAIATALKKVDQNILKLDAGYNETFQKLNQPANHLHINHLLNLLEQFQHNLIIQSLFVKGYHNGTYYDNTTEAEVQEWIGHLKRLNPRKVMIYPIARETPSGEVKKISLQVLEQIAQKVEEQGIEAEVFF